MADDRLESKVRDILAVVLEDLDAVACEVELGVVYIEGIVPSDEQRRLICEAVSRLAGVKRLVACLAIEHLRPFKEAFDAPAPAFPPPVLMHYRSLS